MRRVLQFLWDWKISAIPPDADPYMTGQYIMNTERLKKFLGDEYATVIEKTNSKRSRIRSSAIKRLATAETQSTP